MSKYAATADLVTFTEDILHGKLHFFAVENQEYLKYFRANGSPPEILAQTPETFQYSATISKDSVNRNKKRTKKQLVKRAYIWFSFCTSWSFRVHNKISKTIVPLAW